ncbi:MAG TPA: nodulation protein NfeD [Nitrospirae bacterium]|nr:nodulation protein NfeD [Nitrospirota bacterium]
MARKIFNALLLLSLVLPLLPAYSGSNSVMVLTVSSVINPVSAEFIVKSISGANNNKMEAVIIELDTPGGLDISMRQIIKAISASNVPVIVYVSPSGARAASAGVFITMAADIAAMAPGTNIGAAHPVNMGGKMSKTMKEKVTNDAVAYIKSIAEKRGRNKKWAENAVRKSVSVTDTEALKLNVIDIRADNINDLLRKINGRTVELISGTKKLNTENVTLVREKMGFRLKLLAIITNPNIAYILMMLGFYGLFFELISPGAIFPGVLGGICLILAFYSFQTLPVNYAGVLLIILGIIMFILEIKIVSYGVLTLGGIISMTIGSIMLFDNAMPFIRLSLATIIPAVILTVLFFTVAVRLVYKAWRKQPVTGQEGLIGLDGIAMSDIADSGMVIVHGEYWQAYCNEPVRKGEIVTVESVDGLKIKVKKKKN